MTSYWNRIETFFKLEEIKLTACEAQLDESKESGGKLNYDRNRQMLFEWIQRGIEEGEFDPGFSSYSVVDIVLSCMEGMKNNLAFVECRSNAAKAQLLTLKGILAEKLIVL